MKKVLAPAQMAAADRLAIDSGIPGFSLMQTAGAAAGRAAVELMGGAYGRKVVVVCGKGNNGGDGMIAAAWLQRRGALCRVVTIDDPSAFKGDAARAFRMLGGVRHSQFSPGRFASQLERCDLLIDAVVGTGFKGTLSGAAGRAVSSAGEAAPATLAVDIPSGVNGETGAAGGPVIHADATVTLAALKPGLLLEPGASLAGDVWVADIGIAAEHMQTDIHLVEQADAAAVLPVRPPWAHKRSVGKLAVVAGSASMGGAAALAAAGALRTGAGLVWAAVPESIAARTNQAVLEAIAVGLAETGSGTIEPSAVARVLELAGQADAVAIGPGLSRHPETLEFVRKILTLIDRPLILDADGLFAFASSPEAIASRVHPTVLTPHCGELARLTGTETRRIESDRIGAARAAARQTGAVVLLKGRPTIVAGADGACAVVVAGGPVLATGGTGDVLTGVIGALAAAGLPAFEAAWAGALIHGSAGDLLSEIADRGLTAGDLLDRLPRALGNLQAAH